MAAPAVITNRALAPNSEATYLDLIAWPFQRRCTTEVAYFGLIRNDRPRYSPVLTGSSAGGARHQESRAAVREDRLGRHRRISWMTWRAGRVTRSPAPGCASRSAYQLSFPRVPGRGSGWPWLTGRCRRPRPRELRLCSSEGRSRTSQTEPSGVAEYLPRSSLPIAYRIRARAPGRIPTAS